MEKVKLGEVCSKIGSGATLRGGRKVYLSEGNYALIRSQNALNKSFSSDGLVYISDYAAQKLSNGILEKDDVLLNITGDSVVRCCMVDENILPARVNQRVSIRPDLQIMHPLF